MLILDAAIKTPYRILGIDLPKNNLRHLSHLGMTPGETLEIVTKTKDSAILIIKGVGWHLMPLFWKRSRLLP